LTGRAGWSPDFSLTSEGRSALGQGRPRPSEYHRHGRAARPGAASPQPPPDAAHSHPTIKPTAMTTTAMETRHPRPRHPDSLHTCPVPAAFPVAPPRLAHAQAHPNQGRPRTSGSPARAGYRSRHDPGNLPARADEARRPVQPSGARCHRGPVLRLWPF
jgi:hypothetical protein